jgi:hypothetical protein
MPIAIAGRFSIEQVFLATLRLFSLQGFGQPPIEQCSNRDHRRPMMWPIAAAQAFGEHS